MTTAPHDDNNHKHNAQRASIEELAARLHLPVAAVGYWLSDRMVWRADRSRRGPGPSGR
jgi:hypothetical protein